MKQYLTLARWNPLTFAAIASVFCAVSAWTHDYKQLRVVVNQLDGANVPDIQQREKDMNEILKQCQKHGIYLQVTIEKVNTNQNPTRPDGTPIAAGGKIPGDPAADELDALAKAGEVKTNGVKVWVAKEVRGGTNNVAASNTVVNGSAVIGTPSTVIGEQSGVNGDAHTWLHEVSHTLGLDHAPDAATTNLMNPSRSVGGSATGNGLSADQCKQLQKGADKFSPKTAKTKEQTNQPPAKTVSSKLVDSPESGPSASTPYDLKWSQVVIDYELLNPGNPTVYVDTFINAPLDPPPVMVRYLVWLDLDNDLATGDPAGFDALVTQHVISPMGGPATLRLFPSGMEQPLPEVTTEVVSRFVTGDSQGYKVPVGAVIHCEIPRPMLPGMGPVMRVKVSSTTELFDEVDVIEPEEMATIPPPEPVLTLNVIETLPGNVVSLAGMMFTATTPYRITFDSTVVAEGITSPAGEINADFIAPDLVPGDYLVDAIDASCHVQIAVLRMLDNQGLKIRLDGEQLAITFRTHPGPTYIVEYKENLSVPGPWIELQRTNTVESVVTVFDTPPPGPRFYRWRQE